MRKINPYFSFVYANISVIYMSRKWLIRPLNPSIDTQNVKCCIYILSCRCKGVKDYSIFLLNRRSFTVGYLSLCPLTKTPRLTLTGAIQINEQCHALTWKTIKRDFIISHSSLAAFHSPLSSLSSLIKKLKTVNWGRIHMRTCTGNTLIYTARCM